MIASHAFGVVLSRGVACVLFGVVVACQPRGGSTANPTPRTLPSEGELSSLPLGDVAGAFESALGQKIDNPYHNNKEAISEGQKLFVAMNCADCHGYDGGGGMGPDLTDKYWRYGGTPAAIYQSIFEGRPQGMPAWGRALPPQDIWKLVAYIESLGGSFTPAQYQAGLQGDHDVTFLAPEIHDLGPTFDVPRGAQQGSGVAPNCGPVGGTGTSASSPAEPACRGTP